MELARAGCDLLLTYRGSREEAHETATIARDLGAEVTMLPLALDDANAAEAAVAATLDTLHSLDVLVHNASTYAPSPMATLTAEAVRRDFEINALAPLLLSRACAPRLSRSLRPGGGAIIAMSDLHALQTPRRDFVSYSMSKAALTEMVRCLARDLAPKIRVNAVAPGVVAWPEDGYESDAEAQRRYLSRVPLSRAGTPEEAAKTVRWLALEATYITGQVICLDGGRSVT
jgi:pteridine reductase